MDNIVKKQKTRLGPYEMQLLSYVQMRKMDICCTGEIASALKISSKQERELLSRMGRSGLIIWLKRGAYLIPPGIPADGKYLVSEHYILVKLMEELKGRYQISGPNALHFYGFEDQEPDRVYVYNNRIYGLKKIGGFNFVFIKTSDDRLGSAREIESPGGEKIFMVTKARALLDAVYDWSRYGTMPIVYRWILTNIEKEPAFLEEFINVALQYGNKSASRRIGYLLSLCAVPENLLLKFQRNSGSLKSLITLIPGKVAKGCVNKEWGLIINGAVQPGGF
jgi:predicted transcriptional regulator of viral defense system